MSWETYTETTETTETLIVYFENGRIVRFEEVALSQSFSTFYEIENIDWDINRLSLSSDGTKFLTT